MLMNTGFLSRIVVTVVSLIIIGVFIGLLIRGFGALGPACSCG
jgi:hypothetical protein